MNEIMAYSSARRVGLSALGLKRIGSSLMPSGLCCLLGALICSDFIVALCSSWFAKVNIIVEGEAAAEEGSELQQLVLELEREPHSVLTDSLSQH